MGMFYVLFLILFPLLGAFITYIVGNKKPKFREYFAIGVTLVEFIVMAIALFTYKSIDGPIIFNKVFNLAILFFSVSINCLI